MTTNLDLEYISNSMLAFTLARLIWPDKNQMRNG